MIRYLLSRPRPVGPFADPDADARAERVAYVRDFVALAGMFGVLYGWLVVGSALAA